MVKKYLISLMIVALDKAVPDGVREYFQSLHKELKTFAEGSVLASSNKVLEKEQSAEQILIPSQPPLQRTTSFEKLNELVEFLQTNSIGITMITVMAVLFLLNLFGLWFMFRMNNKLEFVLSQVQQAKDHSQHKEL